MEKASNWAVCSWPSAVGTQAGVGCGKPGCSQAGEGAFPEGMSWEQRALYLCQRVFLGGAQTLCALTFPFCKRTSEFPFFFLKSAISVPSIYLDHEDKQDVS